MNMPQFGKGLAVAAVAMLAAHSAHAATQGVLGPTSTGDLTITLTVDDLVQISDLDDITLATYGSVSLTGGDDVCVYSNSGSYDITATGDGGDTGTAFELTGSGPDSVPYSVEWATSSGAPSGRAMASGTALTGLTGDFTTPDCSASTNARVIISVDNTDLGAAAPDIYSGVLTFMVAPQ